ncbi:homocysteine S-methyltransferase family protein [Leucobacter sp. wl10]|uniref:homocysteine S-methyltransferase family protein n=1 Tax=Leucobacter sp. wl10 TaxID=2304677 RepID=UPI000E5BFD8D|nr:homocysteine S-methyltransferase family protein [Leucobacter sp. wl10]RGE17629.1 homocysteine methyltransferase [Leucobacter sp. wl10]
MTETEAGFGAAGAVLTDGGIETALADRLGQELPEFAAFVLLDGAEGREALRAYYRPFVELARRRGLPLVLDTPTWRANPDWAERLGYDAEALDRANADAVALVRGTAEEHDGSGGEGGGAAEILVNGCVGPRYDDYDASQRMTAEEAERYHWPQVRALAEAGADRVTAVTTLDAAEGVGVVRAAQRARIPVAVSFVVDADGRLAGGGTLAEGIGEVDAATGGAACGFLVNCAHPDEAAAGLAACAGAPELDRIVGFRLNAARHDETGEGDDPRTFARLEASLREHAPNAVALGGCCGTDVPHIAALAERIAPGGPGGPGYGTGIGNR